MRSRDRQSGLTLIGFIFVAAVVVALALLGFRVAPSYIEYFSVVKILKQMIAESRDGVTQAEIRKDFERRTGADYVESVRPTDVELTKEGNTITVSANWTTTLHLVGNVSLLIEFQASASK
jgi:Tfp pilus assembly protein PilE